MSDGQSAAAVLHPATQHSQPPESYPVSERCPLCGATLDAAQDWCLACGAAARTRLAATPRWRLLVAVIAVVIVLSLAILVASLVKLIG